MSTGSASIPLLKAAPEPEQVAERLEGGDWRGMELALLPPHVADDAALDRAIAAVNDTVHGRDVVLTAEAPVSWPSGDHVRVDRLTDEARAGIERSARFAAAIGSPVLTIHLYIPQTAHELRAGGAVDEHAVEEFLAFYARACTERDVIPLIENVPPVLRMRTGGAFFTPIGGHWHDLLEWRERIPELGFTLDTSHAALFRAFANAYPSLFGLESDEGLELERYVEELGPATRVAHVSNASGVLGEGLRYDRGELDLDPVVARLGELVPYVVAEINEPDHRVSPNMKDGYRRIERALSAPAERWRPPPRRLPSGGLDWQDVVGRRDPVPDVLALQESLAGRRVLVTGGAGSIGRSLTSLLAAFRPALVTVLDSHEAALTADRHAKGAARLARFEHVLCDIRDRRRLEHEAARARPDVVFHLAAYKHVDWAERYPEEFAATNLDGSWNVLRAAERAGAATVVVASTDKAARASSLYGRTKRLMETLTALAAERAGGGRAAVRLVNVLGSAGSATELWVRQARAGVPLTLTDPAMVRFWITMAHAATLVAHASLAAAGGTRLLTAAEPVEERIGAIAERIWRAAGPGGPPDVHVAGVRPGETMTEILAGPGEELGEEVHMGAAAILGDAPTAAAAAVVEQVERCAGAEERRQAWLGALAPPRAPVT
ncbi:MAG TPA: polysaccharide biosynthesis protein [Solirubrobacteraceae bacterium]|jgi:nucleoside-diphosphate-sugar epimerase|nr:polysaccharide biosynthesis protein [Solirubrobacteraceae bacterium]